MRRIKEVSGHFVLAFACITAVFWLALMMLLREIAGDDISALPEIAFLGYDAVDLMILFAIIGDEGRQIYANLALRLDMFFALIYGVFLGVFWLWLTGKNSYNHKIIHFLKPIGFVLIPLAVVSDIGENLVLQNLLHTYPDFAPDMVNIASSLTEAKWMILGGFGVLCVWIYGVIRYSRWRAGES